MSKWKPIETAPANSRKMFLVCAFNVTHFTHENRVKNYTSDPVATWSDNGSFPRWKHNFGPTHWCEIPDFDCDE